MTRDKLFLIDGHALMFRMYYAFLRRPMINSRKEDVSVIFGFMKYLLELVRKEQPTHIAVAFDPHCPTFRHEAYPLYKANRDAAPEVIRESLQPLIEILGAMEIPVLMTPGFEADDVIGSAAIKAEKAGFDVFMVTPDKDLGQLVSEHIYQYKPGKGGGENEIVDVAAICARYGISSPKQVIDILAIWGDASDNVPGVDGVGEKGASRLVGKYGSVEGVMAHLDELSEKQAESFRNAAERLKMSKFLVTIKTDIPIECTRDELRMGASDWSRVRHLFENYEFPSLFSLLPETQGGEVTAVSSSCAPAEFCEVQFSELLSSAKSSGKAGIALSSAEVLLLSSEGKVCAVSSLPEAEPLLSDPKIEKCGFGMKQVLNFLRRNGLLLAGHIADAELMHYLMDSEQQHKLTALARSYLNTDIAAAAASPSAEAPAAELDLFSVLEDTAADASVSDEEKASVSILPALCTAVWKELSQVPQQVSLYENIEMPLITILSDMELEGVKIDVQMLAAYGRELRQQIQTKESEIREMAGDRELNILSPKQLGIVLFGKMKLDPKAKPNQNGSYSTDEETLMGIINTHPIVKAILEYRELRKMLSTYVEPLPTLVSQIDGRIHTTYNQTLTATGRLSSVRPNLQNIPVRSDMGKEIRRAFIPSKPGNILLSADYSQIELRLMAVMSRDAGLIEAFREGKDIHTATAAKVFGVQESDVTREQRSKAKTANFGIIYGISAFGLSQRLGIPRSESKELIEEYFRQYPGVSRYIEETKERVRELGYVETMFHRRRYLPMINSRNQVVRSLAERNAVNAPVQGSAADIIKIAMINVARRLKEEKLEAKLVLQVHDELIFDLPASEEEQLRKMVTEEMEGAARTEVTLTVECGTGTNWLEAH